jgi:hypothetical protein
VRRVLSVVLLGVLVVAATGCGGSGTKTASTAGTASATVPSSAPPAIRALAGRMLVAGDLRGFAPEGQRTIATSAQSWVHEYPPPEQETARRRLESLGFMRGVSEHLVASTGNGSEATSVAIQFRSPHSAVANVESEAKNPGFGGKTFAVATIPSAIGLGGVFGAETDYNVAFAAGPYYYLVGEGYRTGTHGAPTREQLITAAQRLYARVHG